MALGSVVLVVALFLVIRHSRATSTSAKGGGSKNDMAGMAGMSTDGAVHLTPSQLATFGVTFGSVEQRTLTTDVRTAGTVVMDEARTATVTPKINGYAERLYANTTGQSVRRGEPLAEIYSPDLIAAEETATGASSRPHRGPECGSRCAVVVR